MGLMAWAGWIISGRGSDPLRRSFAVLLLAGSFPAVILWQSGNVQAVLVLAVALVLAGLDSMREEPAPKRSRAMLLAGLLISLFSEPTLLALVPLLLLIKSTRRTAL